MSLAVELGLDGAAARAVLGATRGVLEADGSGTSRGTALLDSLRRALGLSASDVANSPTDPSAIAAALPSPAARRALADALLIPVCIEGEVSERGARAVRVYADALGVRSHWVALAPALHRRSVLAVKRELFGRSPDASRILRRTWEEDGVRGLLGAAMFVAGLHRDPALAGRFRALGALPEGTLGRSFFEHLTSRGLSFPGEARGMPERMIHHDLMHVVNGYDTDPAGECELAGFYAGFADGDAYTFIVIVLATFQLGMPVSPAVVTPARGAFDPERVLAAFLRGRRLRVDVMGPWDYWALMPLSLAEARAQLGIDDVAARVER